MLHCEGPGIACNARGLVWESFAGGKALKRWLWEAVETGGRRVSLSLGEIVSFFKGKWYNFLGLFSEKMFRKRCLFFFKEMMFHFSGKHVSDVSFRKERCFIFQEDMFNLKGKMFLFFRKKCFSFFGKDV